MELLEVINLTPDDWNLLTCLILAGVLAFAVMCAVEAVKGSPPDDRDVGGL